MISIKKLYLKYVRQYFALYDINIDIKEKEKVAFVGEDESGKTSLLRILVKLEKATKGEVYIKDIPIKKVSFLDDVSVGFLPSEPIFYKNKTVYENFLYILNQHKVKPAQAENAINKCLIEYNIESLKDVKISELTLFEQYVVSLARISLREIEILIVDSVLDKLQNEEQEKFIELLTKKFLDKDCVFIMSTKHKELAKALTNRQIYFENGSIVKEENKG